MGILKKINTVVTIASIAGTSFELMYKTFKWYEKKHRKSKGKEQIARPVIKGA
jgi:hypothetical protein